MKNKNSIPYSEERVRTIILGLVIILCTKIIISLMLQTPIDINQEFDIIFIALSIITFSIVILINRKKLKEGRDPFPVATVAFPDSVCILLTIVWVFLIAFLTYRVANGNLIPPASTIGIAGIWVTSYGVVDYWKDKLN